MTPWSAPPRDQSFGYRLGTTSFIRAGSWADNVALLGSSFDDIELLFFESTGPHALPSAGEQDRLRALKQEHALSFSVHLPLDISLASPEPAQRARAQDVARRTLRLAHCLGAERAVLHVYWGDREHDPLRPSIPQWQSLAHAALQALLARAERPEHLCVEVIDYDFSIFLPILHELPISVALDIGHLARDGQPAGAWLDRLWPWIQVIQWHGTEPGGRDHRSLRHYPEEEALGLLRRCLTRGYRGVLTLEVFGEHDLRESQDQLALWTSRLASNVDAVRGAVPREDVLSKEGLEP